MAGDREADPEKLLEVNARLLRRLAEGQRERTGKGEMVPGKEEAEIGGYFHVASGSPLACLIRGLCSQRNLSRWCLRIWRDGRDRGS